MSGARLPAAVYFAQEAYSTAGPKLMGRNAAGESFLRGLIAHHPSTEFWTQVAEAGHARDFAAMIDRHRPGATLKVVTPGAMQRLAEPGTVFYPGPTLGVNGWQRRAFGDASWSLCGITHTTASAGAMDAIAELLTAPVQPWDALICTSRAVKANVEAILSAQGQYLAERLGATKPLQFQMPVIPLGVHARDFAFDEAARAEARQALGADDDTLIVLFVGRLAFHGKANPLPMYRALERAAATLKPGQRAMLVECGWYANESIAAGFAQAARALCPSIQAVTVDGRDPVWRGRAWAGADIFCSLVDNIQETFGIVPIEAMAAGLPVVVSDWDGYRDTVRDGVDGYRIPTIAPPPGLGGDLALRHALEIDGYDRYCGYASAVTAVDIEATAGAFERLFASAELRREMGANGRRRVAETYDWSVVIPAYEALWTEQAAIRAAAGVPRRAVWPARHDPFTMFAGYPSQLLDDDTMLVLAAADAEAGLAEWRALRGLTILDFGTMVYPNDAELGVVLARAAQGPARAAALVADIAPPRRPVVFRGLLALVKAGVLRLG